MYREKQRERERIINNTMSHQEQQIEEEQQQQQHDDGRGIVLELSPDVAEDLRRRRRRQQQQQQERKRRPKGKRDKARTKDDDDDDDDWNEILPLGGTTTTRTQITTTTTSQYAERQDDENNHDDDDDDNANDDNDVNSTNGVDDDDDDDDDNVSDYCLSFSSSPPPATLPQVLVNFKQLVGYTPATPEEAALLYKQVRAAIWGTAYHHYNDDDDDQQGEQQQQDDEEENIQEACKLDERVSKLFQNGVARHVDTATAAATAAATVNPLSFCRIDYPEYLYQLSPLSCRSATGSGVEETSSPPPPRVVKTAHLWKQLLQRINIPVVDRILDHLQNCSQSLFWKQAMHAEIKHLAAVQQEEFTRHQQATALQEWEAVGRKVKLEELYAVRETFVHRLELAKEKLQHLQNEHEVAVRSALLLERLQQQQCAGGLEALDDFNTDAFALNGDDDENEFKSLFDDGYDFMGNTIEDDDDVDGYNLVSEEEDKETYDDYSSSSSSLYTENNSGGLDGRLDIQEGIENEKTMVADNTAPTNSGNDVQIPSEETQVVQSSELGDNKPNRHAGAAQKQRLRLEQASRDAEYQTKLETAKDLEGRLREELTSHDLKTAMVAAKALEERLEQVDELLETLQEEEWVNEENEGSEQKIESLALKDDDTPHEFSLLDQILAMILGSSPPQLGQDTESHMRYIEKEHLDIVREWRAQFGRLPSAFVKAKPPREAAGSGINKMGESQTSRSFETKEDESLHAAVKNDATFQVTKDRKSSKQALGILDNNESDWEDASL